MGKWDMRSDRSYKEDLLELAEEEEASSSGVSNEEDEEEQVSSSSSSDDDDPFEMVEASSMEEHG